MAVQKKLKLRFHSLCIIHIAVVIADKKKTYKPLAVPTECRQFTIAVIIGILRT
jgi:hypothetical protein